MSRSQSAAARKRIGRVSLYLHRLSWWIYHRQDGQPVRRRIGPLPQAECEASLLNAQLVAAEAGLPIEKLLADRFQTRDERSQCACRHPFAAASIE